MTKQQILKNRLYNLLKKDVTIEQWDSKNEKMIFSFFHLESVYNGLIWYDVNNKQWDIDFQYHKYTKTLEKSLINILKAFDGLSIPYIEQVMSFYRGLAKKVFNAKYSLENILYTIND